MTASVITDNSPISSLSESEQDRIAQILDDYLTAAEQGKPLAPHELLRRYPDDAERLRPYLSGLQCFHAAVAPGATGSALLSPCPPRTAEVIGDFRIVAELGRGGMGVVYEATQLSLQRRVALKVLNLPSGRKAKQIQRFRNEAHAAASIDHPNIVPVHAIGDESGVHFYAMQLIEGHSLASLLAGDQTEGGSCRQGTTAPMHQRTSRQRAFRGQQSQRPVPPSQSKTGSQIDVRQVAKYGVQAAGALQAAHEVGVIHRDVKPSNLLVDNQHKLWVTDFGLALCRDHQGLTQTGDVLGTMRYMSPEQARGSGGLVDHRTDVYSLGVTLYELATQHHPSGEASALELLTSRDRYQPKPLRHWRSDVPLDFQNVVMKAIAADPTERYATAGDLAEDLLRFLNGETVKACPPSLANRASKWVRRHRGLVAAIGVFLALAFVGQSVNSILLAHKNQEKQNALLAAQENLQQAHAVLDRFGTRLVDQLAAIPGAEGVRYQLLEDSLELYEQLELQAAGKQELDTDLARAYSKIGLLSEKLGDKQKALRKHLAARKVWQEKLSDQPGNLEVTRELALCHNRVGLLLGEQGRLDESLAELAKARNLQQQLVTGHPELKQLSAELAVTLNNLGFALQRLDEPAEAIKRFREAIAIGEGLAKQMDSGEAPLRGLAASYNNLGSLIASTNREAAADAYRQAVELQREIIGEQPNNRIYQGELARTYNNLGSLFANGENWVQAEVAYGNAIKLQTKLVDSSPLAMSYRRDLAISYNNLGMTQSRQQRFFEAENSFESALRMQQLLASAAPNDGKMLSDLGGIYNNLGLLRLEQEDFPLAEEAFIRAVRYQQQAFEMAPRSANRKDFLCNHYANYATCLRKLKKEQAAKEVDVLRAMLVEN